MCGRFVSSTPPDALAAYFGAQTTESVLEPSYNVAPTNEVYVVVETPDAQRTLETFRWGFIPSWAKDAKIGNRMINARAEGVATSGAFRRSFARKRCIIPVDGFYEWMKVPGDPKRKQPIYLHRPDGEPLAFAGLWDTWKAPEGDVVRSCTIITGEPNVSVARIHDRMPVILPPSVWDLWLDPTVRETERLSPLLVPAPPELLRLDPVATTVNNPRTKGSELIVPVQVDVDLGLDVPLDPHAGAGA